jgi:hypothetical protein
MPVDDAPDGWVALQYASRALGLSHQTVLQKVKRGQRFDLRHRNDKQHSDYDPAFRDWVFWWYLATVELTNRLLDRQRARPSAAASAQ